MDDVTADAKRAIQTFSTPSVQFRAIKTDS